MLLTHYWNCSVGAGLLYSELIPSWKILDWFTLAEAMAFLFLSREQRARKILSAWIVRTASLQFWCNLLYQWDDDNTLHQLWPKDLLLASKLCTAHLSSQAFEHKVFEWLSQVQGEKCYTHNPVFRSSILNTLQIQYENLNNTAHARPSLLHITGKSFTLQCDRKCTSHFMDFN